MMAAVSFWSVGIILWVVRNSYWRPVETIGLIEFIILLLYALVVDVRDKWLRDYR